MLDAVDALGPRGSEVAVTEEGGWTSKDVLAHLIHYAGQIARALGAQIEPPSYVVQETRRLSGQEWNERAVEFWSGSSLEEVRSELERVADLVEQRVETLSDEDLAVRDRVPWAPDRPLWEFIGHDTFLHEWPAHAKQIESAARS